jgi:hypothetical protein
VFVTRLRDLDDCLHVLHRGLLASAYLKALKNFLSHPVHNFIQDFSVKFTSVRRSNYLGIISVDFDVIDQLDLLIR